MNKIKFYPCKHTRRDGLYYSAASVQSTGRLTLCKNDGREYTIKCCQQCSKGNPNDTEVSL